MENSSIAKTVVSRAFGMFERSGHGAHLLVIAAVLGGGLWLVSVLGGKYVESQERRAQAAIRLIEGQIRAIDDDLREHEVDADRRLDKLADRLRAVERRGRPAEWEGY